MPDDWKDWLKKVGALSLFLVFLRWLFTPADPRFNAKTKVQKR